MPKEKIPTDEDLINFLKGIGGSKTNDPKPKENDLVKRIRELNDKLQKK